MVDISVIFLNYILGSYVILKDTLKDFISALTLANQHPSITAKLLYLFGMHGTTRNCLYF